MIFHFDIKNNRLSLSRGGPAITKLTIPSQTDVPLEVALHDGSGTVIPSPTGFSMKFGLTDPLNADGSLAVATSWTNGGNGRYTATLDTNTNELITALGTSDDITVDGQFYFTNTALGTFNSQMLDITVERSTVTVGTGTPVEEPDPDAYVAARAVLYDRAQSLTDGQVEQALANLDSEKLVKATSFTAANGGEYVATATLTVTDPTGVEGRGFRVLVRGGTATIGGTAYSVAGTTVWRVYQSGAWASYAYFSGSLGVGDMLKAVYDPTNIGASAFDRANHTGTQTLATISDAGTAAAANTGDFAAALGVDDNYVTDAEKVVIGNTSGTNSGDVTVTDTAEIDLTLTGQNLSAAVGEIAASKIALSRIAGSTFYTLQNFRDNFASTGLVIGNGIVDDGDGTISVAAGSVSIRATNDPYAPLLFADFAAESGANVDLTDSALNYVYVEYNAGAPRVVASTTKPTDLQTNVLLAAVHREGTVLHLTLGQRIDVSDPVRKITTRLQETDPFHRVTGGILSETGTRNIAVTAGDWWEGLYEFSTAAVDTSAAGTFTYYYRDGVGGFTEVDAQTQINNTQYDNGTGTLATLGTGRYGVHWVYIGQDGDVDVVYGRGDYTLPQAQDALPPSSLPGSFEIHDRIIGKIIVLKSAATFTSTESAFQTLFTPSLATDHGELAGLADDDHAQYHNDSRALTWIGTRSTADLADSSNKRYVTDAQLTVIGNTSNTNTGDNATNSQYSGLVSNATHTGDATGSTALTLATVNSNVGSFGSATAAGTFTVNAKGLITAASATTVTPAVGSITGLGTGIATFLATPSSANLSAAVSDETGSGALVFATSPTLANPTINNYTEGVVAIGNSGATQTLSLTSGTFQTVTLTASCTFTMPTATAGKSFILKVMTGAGSYTATFTGVKWSGGAAPTITATASKYDLLSFVADGTAWSGSALQNFTP